LLLCIRTIAKAVAISDEKSATTAFTSSLDPLFDFAAASAELLGVGFESGLLGSEPNQIVALR